MEILIPLIMILILEFVADFIMQTREIALNKSSSLKHLALHLNDIFLCLVIYCSLMWGWAGMLFTVCYVALHGIQDWFIWRWYKAGVISRLGFWGMDLEYPEIKQRIESFKYWEDKSFYDTIGFDRLLHVVTLVVLYGLILL